jgi:hypothetical protein
LFIVDNKSILYCLFINPFFTVYSREPQWIEFAQYAKVRSVYVNMYKQPKRFMGDGFLLISLLKYQMARLGLLKLWIEIEASDELIPIGLKTDCFFVAQKV